VVDVAPAGRLTLVQMDALVGSRNEPAGRRPAPLDADKHLLSDRWLDQPDAAERIAERVAAGTLSADDARLLGHFADKGYLITHIDLDADAVEAFDQQISRLWEERPANLAVSLPGPGGPLSFADYDGEERVRGYRIPDLHGFSQNAMDLYLHPELFRIVELIFEQPAIAFQSLYFEYGSMQAMHRDPMFVPVWPVSNLVAAWIALEDITADSGPLMYMPGSHRCPWYEFKPDSIEFAPNLPLEERQKFTQWMFDMMRIYGLERQTFTCKRGDVLIWHTGLMHGGMAIDDPGKTRKSFVVHYSTAADYPGRTAQMHVREGEKLKLVRQRTETICEAPGARGLDSPLKARG
jgi:phytanoyl-CoA hydroxylase